MTAMREVMVSKEEKHSKHERQEPVWKMQPGTLYFAYGIRTPGFVRVR